MHQKTFCDEFLNRSHGTLGGINISILRFATKKNDPKIKLFCFVEGNSDILFYKGVIPKAYKLSQEEVCFIVNHDSSFENDYYNLHGKKSVINMCKYVFNKHLNSKSQCKFIVDMDYDDLDLEKHNLSDDIASRITVLPCYSFENYYFIDENLKSIFHVIFGSMDFSYYDEFVNLLAHFLLESSEYNAFKKLSVMFSLHKKYPEQLSQFLKFKDEQYEYIISNGHKLSLNVEPIKSIARVAHVFFEEISAYEAKLLMYEYEQYCAELRNNPLIVKGKLLFSLLVKYINYNCDKDLTAHDLYRYSNQLSCPGLVDLHPIT